MDSGNQNQFFLVVEEILQCRWTFCGDEREGSMYSGCVVVIRPHNRKNEFEVHRGSPFLTNGPGLVIREGGLPQDKVISITDKEFDILLGSNYNGDVGRFQLHSSGRLKWVCQLKVGDEVQVKLGDNVDELAVPGVIKGSATRLLQRIDYGLHFIVEITDEAFEYYFGDRHDKRIEFLHTKNCDIIISADQLYPVEQTLLEAAAGVKGKLLSSMTQYSRKRSLSETLQQIGQQYETEMKQTVLELVDAISEKEKVIIRLNLELDQQKQKLSAHEAEIEELHDELREKQKAVDTIKEEQQQCEQRLRDQQLQHEERLREQQEQYEHQVRDQQLQHEERLRKEQEQYEQQLRDQQLQYEERLREKEVQHEEQLIEQQVLYEQQLIEEQVQHEEQLRKEQEQYEQQREQALAELRQQNERNLRELQEHHQLEQNHFQREQDQLQQQVTQLQQELQVITDQKQQLQARVETAFAYMRGDPGTSQVGFDAIELWEVQKEDVHVSNKILGTGGWGYVAEGMFRGQKVAVKCLHRGILSQFTTNHVRREISIMAQVRHPNLVLLIGAVLNADTGPLIITELLDRSLRSAYEEHLLEEHYKFPILRDVAAALTYLHSHRRPIIHRDVSSANVLLDAVRSDALWRAKLSDFGSANLIRLSTTPAEGAAPYAAPEVRTEARNQQTPKVDVYSFGVLLCEISLCQFPPDPNEFATFLASVRDNADPRLYELAQNCTKRDPEQRPSMREVLTQIGELIPIE